MFQKINIYDNAWIDLLFQGRNQNYGAYQLRKDTSKRHILGIIAALVFFSLLVWLPILYKQITPKRVERNVEVTVLSDIQIEQKKPEEPQNIIVEKPAAPPLKSTIKFTPPVVKLDEEVLDEDLMRTQDELLETELTISIADIKGTDEEHGIDIAELNDMIVDEGAATDEPFVIVEQMPEFPGGETALRKFLANAINTRSLPRRTVSREKSLSTSLWSGTDPFRMLP